MAKVEVQTEITGNVWKVETEVGSQVAEGEVLVILESMKMEIPIVAPEDGTVTTLNVNEGDVVTEGQVVVIIEA